MGLLLSYIKPTRCKNVLHKRHGQLGFHFLTLSLKHSKELESFFFFLVFCIFVIFYSFHCYYWKCKNYRPCIPDPASKFLQIGNKSDIWQLRHNFPTWCHSKLFWYCRISLVTFNHWSKFNVNISTGSGVMEIFVYKRLTRNPEIGNTTICVSAHIGRFAWVRGTIFGRNVFNEKLLKLQNVRFTPCTVSKLLRENQLGEG